MGDDIDYSNPHETAELGYRAGLERGRHEGVEAVFAALRAAGPHHALDCAKCEVIDWLESPQGKAAVAAVLAGNKIVNILDDEIIVEPQE
jgi:hypothetical protein